MGILGFADRDTEKAFDGDRVSARCPWRDLTRTVRRKLDMLNAAEAFIDLRAPPSNRPEVLKGKLKGLCSIRVNKRWRIVFRWTKAGPDEVRVMDYH